MAYLRDRRAFGNIGTRKFRGARFGDPLSPRGPQYTLEGRVLDYSTDVGPFTIVDQSGESNTATLYSGRGLTMDAVNDTVTYATGYGAIPRTATVWMRVTSLGARTLNSAGSSFIFTPTATNVWEQLSSTASALGNLTWTAGSDCDIGDLVIGTEHWTHNDWSDPTGDTSNGKTIVDSGPNQLHGTCTGCSGFTGEATIPQTADRNWNKYQVGDGSSGQVALGSTITLVGDFSLSFYCRLHAKSVNQVFLGSGASNMVQLTSVNQWRLDIGGTANIIAGASGTTNVIYDVVVSRVGTNVTLSLNGVDFATDFGNSANFVIDYLYSRGSSRYVNGAIWDVSIDGTAYTGLGNDPWADTIGSNDGTESGTFTRELVTASDANDQIDALGTAISEPRLNTQQLNLFGDGEYSLTTDSDSLDVTTTATWELWGNFYGVPGVEYLISKYLGTGNQRSWAVTLRSDIAADTVRLVTGDGVGGSNYDLAGLTDSLGQLVITYDNGTIKGYWNASLMSGSGAVKIPMFVGTADIEIGSALAGTAAFASRKIGSAKLYNVALTADEVLTNYNTQKSKYGLGILGEIDLFLVAGQSNAVGASGTPSAIIPDTDKANLYGVDGAIGNIVDPVFTGVDTGTGTMWPSFADSYISLTGRSAGIIGYAKGGAAQSALADSGSGNWDAAGLMYGSAISRLNAAITKFINLGYTVNVKGILWSQGEQDAEKVRDSTIVAQDYTDALAAMMVRFRAEYGATLPLHMVRTGIRTGVADTGGQAIRDAQDAYVAGDANSYMATTDTVNFPTWGWMADTVHYNQTGNDYCGDKLADSAASLL